MASSDAYYSYCTWAQDIGHIPMSVRTFSRSLEQRFPKAKRKGANDFVRDLRLQPGRRRLNRPERGHPTAGVSIGQSVMRAVR
jgi:hypothetical protein